MGFSPDLWDLESQGLRVLQRVKPVQAGDGPRVPASRLPSRSLPPRLLFSSLYRLRAARAP
jgi:hypothetical protein